MIAPSQRYVNHILSATTANSASKKSPPQKQRANVPKVGNLSAAVPFEPPARNAIDRPDDRQ
jgi:hypothetical protein